jgi:hypothetical protein
MGRNATVSKKGPEQGYFEDLAMNLTNNCYLGSEFVRVVRKVSGGTPAVRTPAAPRSFFPD